MPQKIKLNRTSAYYADRLKTLSVNNEEYDVVIREQDGCFVLYRNPVPLERWERITHMGRSGNSYQAIISFEDEDLCITIKMRSFEAIAFFTWCLFIAGVGIFLMIRGDHGWLLFCFMLVAGFLFTRLERSRFKKFIPYFLNNL